MEPIVADTVDVIEDVSSCLFLGKCKVREYEYYFYLNDEKIKADECSSNLYGRTSCTYNGIEYNNVAYETIFVKEYIKQSEFRMLEPLMLLCGISIICFSFKLIIGRS